MLNVVVLSAYMAILLWIYVAFLSDRMSYLGFTYDPKNWTFVYYSVAFCLAVSQILVGRFDRYSRFFLSMVFHFSFVPIMLFVPLQEMENVRPLAFQASMGAAFMIALAIPSLAPKLGRVRLPPVAFGIATYGAFAVLSLYLISVIDSGSLRLAAVADVYEQRSAGSAAIGGSYAGYAAGVLSCSVAPLMMAVGIVRRRFVMFGAGVAGLFLVYMILALKSVALTIVMIPLFHFVASRRGNFSGGMVALLALAFVSAPALLFWLQGWSTEPTASNIFISMIMMRTIGLPAALTGVYADFFAANPTTAFSHVNIVKLFVDYPYDQVLGYVISERALKAPGMNANASFWATDGFAAFGLWGAPLAGLLIGIVLLVADSLTLRAEKPVVFLASIPFLMIIMNSSMFPSLLTGGGALLFVLLYLYGATLEDADGGAVLSSGGKARERGKGAIGNREIGKVERKEDRRKRPKQLGRRRISRGGERKINASGRRKT